MATFFNKQSCCNCRPNEPSSSAAWSKIRMHLKVFSLAQVNTAFSSFRAITERRIRHRWDLRMSTSPALWCDWLQVCKDVWNMAEAVWSTLLTHDLLNPFLLLNGLKMLAFMLEVSQDEFTRNYRMWHRNAIRLCGLISLELWLVTVLEVENLPWEIFPCGV